MSDCDGAIHKHGISICIVPLHFSPFISISISIIITRSISKILLESSHRRTKEHIYRHHPTDSSTSTTTTTIPLCQSAIISYPTTIKMFSTKSAKSDTSSMMSSSSTSSLIKDKFTTKSSSKPRDSRSPREKQLARMKDRPTSETLAAMALMK